MDDVFYLAIFGYVVLIGIEIDAKEIFVGCSYEL